MHGVLLVDKPEGLTSAEVVRRVKRVVGGKVGHLGTLDPFASGVLPLCLGEGTKIAQFLNTADKTYTGTIRLGARTDSGDRTGTVVETAPVPALSPERCAQVAKAFLGDRLQTPPMYSALKRDGVPLYELARRGVEVDRAPRRIRIHHLTLQPLDSATLSFEVACSKGTYVRVLAEEVGTALGTVAHLATLRRTQFGRFSAAAAVPLPLDHAQVTAALIPPGAALADLPELAVDDATAMRVQRGQVYALRGLARPPHHPASAKLIGPNGTLLAIVVTDARGQWQFARVLAAN